MKKEKYMLDSKSFMPFAAVAVMTGGGVFVALARGWENGALGVIAGVLLILAAAATVAAVVLIGLRIIPGILMLAPAGLTLVALMLHAAEMLVLKQSYRLRIELLFIVLFAVMILVMLAHLRGRKEFDYKKTLLICVIIGAVALIACFVPLMFAGESIGYAFSETVTKNLPIIFYFAAYIFYFAGLERGKSGEEKEDV